MPIPRTLNAEQNRINNNLAKQLGETIRTDDTDRNSPSFFANTIRRFRGLLSKAIYPLSKRLQARHTKHDENNSNNGGSSVAANIVQPLEEKE